MIFHRHPSFLLAALLIFAPIARAEVSPISIRVEQTNDTDNDRFKKSQSKTLKIHVTNASNQDFAGLRVKYWFFGKDLKDRDLEILKDGETKADVKARSTEMVESARAEATAIEAHSEGKGKKGGNNKAGKKVPASGERFIGYGVQILEGEKLLTEYFSAPSLKASARGAR